MLVFPRRAVLIALLAPGGAPAAPLELRLAYQDTENEPYQLGNGSQVDAKKPGLAVELMRLAALRAGLRPRFERLPWKRALEHLRGNEVDGVFGASFSVERQELGVYPMRDGQVDSQRRAYRNAYRLYALRDAQPSWDGKQLSHLSGPVGATRGYSVLTELRALGVPIDEGLSLRADFHKLQLGHIGALAALEPAADAWLDRHPEAARRIVKLSPALVQKDYYLLLSKGFVQAHPGAAEAVWNAIAELRSGPEWEHLLQRYLGP